MNPLPARCAGLALQIDASLVRGPDTGSLNCPASCNPHEPSLIAPAALGHAHYPDISETLTHTYRACSDQHTRMRLDGHHLTYGHDEVLPLCVSRHCRGHEEEMEVRRLFPDKVGPNECPTQDTRTGG